MATRSQRRSVTRRGGRSISISRTLERFHKPLGMLVFCHQLLYEELGRVFFVLCKTNQSISEVIASHVSSFDARVDLFSQLANLAFYAGHPKAKARVEDRVKSIVQELKEVNSERNKIVHGTWMGIPHDLLTITKRNRRKPKLSWETHNYTPKSIDLIVRRMWAVWQRLRKFEAFVGRFLQAEYQRKAAP
jgi:hypothetical protein